MFVVHAGSSGTINIKPERFQELSLHIWSTNQILETAIHTWTNKQMNTRMPSNSEYMAIITQDKH